MSRLIIGRTSRSTPKPSRSLQSSKLLLTSTSALYFFYPSYFPIDFIVFSLLNQMEGISDNIKMAEQQGTIKKG